MEKKRHLNIKQNFQFFSTHAVQRSFERELVKLLDYEMISIFLKHSIDY